MRRRRMATPPTTTIMIMIGVISESAGWGGVRGRMGRSERKDGDEREEGWGGVRGRMGGARGRMGRRWERENSTKHFHKPHHLHTKHTHTCIMHSPLMDTTKAKEAGPDDPKKLHV